MENVHNKAIPVDVVEDVKRRVTEIFNILHPYMIALTSEERQRLPKMGEKTLSFVSKAYELAQNNSNLCPSYFDMNEFRIDFEDATQLIALKTVINQVYEGIVDTETVAGSEAYQAALLFYDAAKTAAKKDIYGAKAVYEELKKRFPSRKKSNSTATETDTDEDSK
jgi:hypothetical protein